MKTILVTGYYHRNNLGDDMFRIVIPKMFTGCKFVFITINNAKVMSDFSMYHCILVGGGDLINEYFHQSILTIRSKYFGPIYGISLGVPYIDNIYSGFASPFDHIFVRNKSTVGIIQKIHGSKSCSYLPDLVMKLQPWKDIETPHCERKVVGVSLTRSSINLGGLDGIVSIFKKLIECTSFIFHFIAFDTSGNIGNDDFVANDLVCKQLPDERIINDKKRYKPFEMVKIYRSLRCSISSRFHSMILSVINGTPTVPFSYTNKVRMWCEEHSYPNAVLWDEFNFKIPVEETVKAFHNVNSNLTSLYKLNKKITIAEQATLNTQLVNNIVKNEQDTFENNIMRNKVTTKSLSDKYTRIIEEITGKPVQDSSKLLAKSDAEVIAGNICFEITKQTSNSYSYGMTENLIDHPFKLFEMIEWVVKDFNYKNTGEIGFNMTTVSNGNLSGLHRSGMNYAIQSLFPLNNSKMPLIDFYCDATFGWARKSPCVSLGLIPYRFPWAGFFHHTPDTKYTKNNIVNSTATKEFLDSLEMCLGFFVFSTWLKNWLHHRLRSLGFGHIPISVLMHPTEIDVPKFNTDSLDKIRVINIGAWMRDSYAIYDLDVPNGVIKLRLKGREMNNYFPPKKIELDRKRIERNEETNSFLYCLNLNLKRRKMYWKELGLKSFNEVPNFVDGDEYSTKLNNFIRTKIDSVFKMEFVTNDVFDGLLIINVVFLDLIEASAVNTVVECMARNTPLIVNRLESVEEYLGSKYPLFYDDRSEVSSLLNKEKLMEGHRYMVENELWRKVSVERFYKEFHSSVITQSTRN